MDWIMFLTCLQLILIITETFGLKFFYAFEGAPYNLNDFMTHHRLK